MISPDQVRLAVLINSFNRLDLLRQAIESLQTNLNLAELCPAILIFDAGSHDGSREFVQGMASRDSREAANTFIDFFIDGRGQKDQSFSAGVNCLAEAAIARYPNLRYLLLFETDNYLRAGNTVGRALRLLEAHEDTAAVGFTVVRHDGRHTGFGCALPTVAQLVLGQQLTAALRLDKPQRRDQALREDELNYSDVVYTSPLLAKVGAWQAVGGMDSTGFPFSDCDVDLCWRWRKAGWRVGVIKTDRVEHDNRGAPSKWSEHRTLHFHAARVKLLKIHRGFNFWLFYPLLFLRHAAELVCLALVSPLLSSPAKRLKARWNLLSRLHRRYRERRESGEAAPPMRVLLYSRAFWPMVGGVETYARLLARGLAVAKTGGKSIELTVATSAEGPAELPPDGAMILRRPSFWKLWGLIRKADVVMLAGPVFLPLCLGLLARKAVVIEHHGYQASCPNGLLLYEPDRSVCPEKFLRGQVQSCIRCNRKTRGLAASILAVMSTALRRLLCHSVARNICVSSHVEKRVALPRTRVIYHGLPDSSLSRKPPAKTTRHALVFAYVGRITGEKGLPLFLRAASELKREGRHFKVRIVGDGPGRGELEALAEELGLSDRFYNHGPSSRRIADEPAGRDRRGGDAFHMGRDRGPLRDGANDARTGGHCRRYRGLGGNRQDLPA